MPTKIFSAAVVGLDCQLIEVEADVLASLPKFNIVGLPDVAVQESRQRVRSAIKNSALSWPRGAINVNLAPAHLKKQGPAYDLPIALSILLTDKKNQFDCLDQSIFIGELSLDGHLRSVSGVLSIVLMMKKEGIKKIFLPASNAAEAALVDGIEIYPVSHLSQLIKHCRQEAQISTFEPTHNNLLEVSPSDGQYDMAYIQGQEHVKRALEIAAAGGHNILMQGPPGSGKTLLARTLPTILPPMVLDEALEVTKIYSVAGLLPSNQPLITTRPFRSPHHSASMVSLVGGGTWPRPGEISLAHNGVLFLDEFVEFPRAVLDSLRQPLEDGLINISRIATTLQFPARFILLASMNPCPCGYYNDPDKNCVCSASQIHNYTHKISGPLLDRIDIHIDVPRVLVEKLQSVQLNENSKAIQARVNSARQRQIERFKNIKIFTNSVMSSEEVRRHCHLVPAVQELLKQAAYQLNLSTRSYYRILKLARTIADLSGQADIKTEHVAEALQYRPKVE